MLSATVRSSSRLKNWKTMPIRSRRKRASACSLSWSTRRPVTVTAALGRPVQARDEVQQRGLAAARGAGHGEGLALGDGEVERSERGRAGAVVALGHAASWITWVVVVGEVMGVVRHGRSCPVGYRRSPGRCGGARRSVPVPANVGAGTVGARRPRHRHPALPAEDPAAGSSLRSTPAGRLGRPGRPGRQGGRGPGASATQ